MVGCHAVALNNDKVRRSSYCSYHDFDSLCPEFCVARISGPFCFFNESSIVIQTCSYQNLYHLITKIFVFVYFVKLSISKIYFCRSLAVV